MKKVMFLVLACGASSVMAAIFRNNTGEEVTVENMDKSQDAALTNKITLADGKSGEVYGYVVKATTKSGKASTLIVKKGMEKDQKGLYFVEGSDYYQINKK